jgi:hypothetical protein
VRSVIPTIATVVGSSVSSAVYTSIVTTGDVGAAALGRGINYLGKGIGYGAELLGGDRVAIIARAAGEAGEFVAAPAIRASSKTVALGTSIVAGTLAGLVTAGIAHGSIALYGYSLAAYERYKEPVMAAVNEAASVASETVMKKIAAPLPKVEELEETKNIF